jgi:hypothetical protein
MALKKNDLAIANFRKSKSLLNDGEYLKLNLTNIKFIMETLDSVINLMNSAEILEDKFKSLDSINSGIYFEKIEIL